MKRLLIGPLASLLLLTTACWSTSNFPSKWYPQTMLGEGRVYGGGLHKLELKELGNVPASAIADLLPEWTRPRQQKQGELFETVPA